MVLETRRVPMGRMIINQILKGATRGRITRPGRMYALMRLPTLLRLGYALLRDPRVPLWMRVSTVGILGLIFSPVDLVGNFPILGQFWDFTLSVIVLEQFINLAPPDVVNEHIRRLGLEKKVRLRRV
jgi:uncharacterized membrane protein YkvA (DUF1232 family)